jgi:hypothetical protein
MQTQFQINQLTSAKGDRQRHYRNLNKYQEVGVAAEHMNGFFWEIDEATYNHFLELLPPIYKPFGFVLSEALTGSIRAYFFRADGRFWCGYAGSDSERMQIVQAVTSIAAPMEAL